MQPRPSNVRHHNPYEQFAPDDDNAPVVQDWTAGYEPKVENELQSSGLRGRKLTIVLVVLCVLWVIAGITLLCNLLLITRLAIGSKGMKSMQLHEIEAEDGTIEHLVQFTAHDIDLGEVITNHGSIKGTRNKDLYVQGERVLLKTLVDQEVEAITKQSIIDENNVVNASEYADEPAAARFILEDGRIRVDGVSDFKIFEQTGGKSLAAQLLFSARQPQFMPDKRIKRVATSRIITNLIRSPVNESLRFEVDNLAFRGNEGNRFNSRQFIMEAENNIRFRTSSKGALRIKVDRDSQGIFFPHTRKMQLSTSPSLSANLLASRLCVCTTTHRLFVVTGNLPCAIHPKFCY